MGCSVECCGKCGKGCGNIHTLVFFRGQIPYSFSLLYNVFGAISSNCAALAFVVSCLSECFQYMFLFGIFLRNVILGVDSCVSRISLPSSGKAYETALSKQCGAFDDILHLP